MNALEYILLGTLLTVAGALPLGLVNLSVLDISSRRGINKAMVIAHGATWIEVIYGLTALMAASVISGYIDQSKTVRLLIILIPAAVGIAFIFLRQKHNKPNFNSMPGFLTGVVLNLASVQVFLYWIMVITYLNTTYNLQLTVNSIVLFSIGIMFGKMGVLYCYAAFSKRILSRSQFISRNINHIIGSILLFTALIQLIR